MALTQEQLQRLGGLGMFGSGVAGLFGGNKNPFDKANKYYEQIPGQVGPYYDPYMQSGKRALGGLEEEYGDLLGDPGGKLNQFGEGYQQSPGFKFALDQALGASGRAAAAGGMAGSPAHQQDAMQTATGLANQDYYNWLDKTTGLYGKGLEGQQGLAGMGFNANKNMADMIAQMLAQQGDAAFKGQASQNQSNPWGNIFGGLLGAFS